MIQVRADVSRRSAFIGLYRPLLEMPVFCVERVLVDVPSADNVFAYL
jgi:hypothetical protein